MVDATNCAARVIGTIDNAEMPGVYRDHNVLVFPSIGHEGLPVTLLEAMAAGHAVIATATGGTPEIIEDGVNGLLVAPDNPAEIADRLLQLDRDPELKLRLGARARATIERRFELTQIADQTLSHLAAAVKLFHGGTAQTAA